MKRYNLTTKRYPRKARNARRRELGMGGGQSSSSVTYTSMGGSYAKDPSSHTHTNKEDLDKITIDGDDYVNITQRHGADKHYETNKAKAGYADEAYDLSEDSPARKDFVSRLHDDYVKGIITFEQMIKAFGISLMGGIHSCDANGNDTFRAGGLTGAGGALYTDASGHTNLEVDNIIARRKWMVNVLEVQKETFAGGNLNLTNAHGTIFRVYGFDDSGYSVIQLFGAKAQDGRMVVLSLSSPTSQKFLGKPIAKTGGFPYGYPTMYKVYFMREDENVAVEDMWHVGDMALCKTMNMAAGARSWHRVVTSHGVEQLEDGKQYNYIIVSNSPNPIDVTSEDGKQTVHGVLPYDTDLLNSVPHIGDKVVQYGSVTEEERMGMTRIDSRGDGEGGIYVFEGIGKKTGTPQQFSPAKEPIVISPRRVEVNADKIRFVSRNEHGEIIGDEDLGERFSKIEMNADGIALKVHDTGVPNILHLSKTLDTAHYIYNPSAAGTEMYKDFVNIGVMKLESSTSAYEDILIYKNLHLSPSTKYCLSIMACSPIIACPLAFFIHKGGKRAVKWVKNGDNGTITQAADGRTVLSLTKAWKLHYMSFETADDLGENEDVSLILGRLEKTDHTITAYVCAPKLECGEMPTVWRPHEEDLEDEMLDTGIDIKNQEIVITSDKVVVRNNAGDTTALIDENGQITAALINAVKMVTEVLAAENIAANNLVIGGSSQFGDFKTDTSGNIINNADSITCDMHISPQEMTYRQKDAGGVLQEIRNGYYFVQRGSVYMEMGNLIKMMKSVLPHAELKGQVISVPETTREMRESGIYNDAYYVPSGTFAGLVHRTRSLAAPTAGAAVQIDKMDYYIMLKGNNKMEVHLPPAAQCQHGQRIEIRNCTSAANTIVSDASDMSDKRPIGMNCTKIYIYDKEMNVWWVNNIG